MHSLQPIFLTTALDFISLTTFPLRESRPCGAFSQVVLHQDLLIAQSGRFEQLRRQLGEPFLIRDLVWIARSISLSAKLCVCAFPNGYWVRFDELHYDRKRVESTFFTPRIVTFLANI